MHCICISSLVGVRVLCTPKWNSCCKKEFGLQGFHCQSISGQPRAVVVCQTKPLPYLYLLLSQLGNSTWVVMYTDAAFVV